MSEVKKLIDKLEQVEKQVIKSGQTSQVWFKKKMGFTFFFFFALDLKWLAICRQMRNVGRCLRVFWKNSCKIEKVGWNLSFLYFIVWVFFLDSKFDFVFFGFGRIFNWCLGKTLWFITFKGESFFFFGIYNHVCNQENMMMGIYIFLIGVC